MEKHARMNITLPQSVADELNRLAEEMNDKKSRIIVNALESYFDELDGIIAEKRLNDLKRGKTEAIPAKDVWIDLGLQ